MTDERRTRGIRDSITQRELRQMLNPRAFKPAFEVEHPQREQSDTYRLEYDEMQAFQRPQPELEEDHLPIGNIPIKVTEKGPVVPDLTDIYKNVPPVRWTPEDWERWRETLVGNPCLSVPKKPSRVSISVGGEPRIAKISNDCCRAYTVNQHGDGCVINIITERVDANFSVDTDPSVLHRPSDPVVNPFTKGGINHKYQHLYVPASFYSERRSPQNGGFYVAVVDIDPSSSTYLETITHIPCGWIPEEVAFSEDEEIGIIANYMQGTVTIFDASDHSILADEVDGFDGASESDAGGPWGRSVRVGDVPDVGNRAFYSLTDETSSDGYSSTPGVAIIDLDDSSYPRTNFTHRNFQFIDGVALTPDNRKLLMVEGGGQLHVAKVDQEPPVFERTIELPTEDDQRYFGGIAVRPTGDLAFLATGYSDPNLGPDQGDALVCVNYETEATIELPNGLPAYTWGVEIHEFGDPLKPYLSVNSLSGELSIIPC